MRMKICSIASVVFLTACGAFGSTDPNDSEDPAHGESERATRPGSDAGSTDVTDGNETGTTSDGAINPPTCEACPQGFFCSDGVTCAVRPTSVWSIAAWSAQVEPLKPSGAPWDAVYGGADGGLISSDPPDARACVDLKDGFPPKCSASVTNTLTPAWREKVGEMTASALMGGLSVSLEDNDGTFTDKICPAFTISVTHEDLLAGQKTVGCSSSQVTFHFSWVRDL